ncbi:MAG: hypothetical protein KDE46_30695, partial [Caldilineaceae bacterium]|nr:hypothetical protein [Caldilineaceae bacterium]
MKRLYSALNENQSFITLVEALENSGSHLNRSIALFALSVVLIVSTLYWGGNPMTVFGQDEQPAFVPGQL